MTRRGCAATPGPVGNTRMVVRASASVVFTWTDVAEALGDTLVSDNVKSGPLVTFAGQGERRQTVITLPLPVEPRR